MSQVPEAEARRLAELGLMAAGLIHELRQPLFALKALAQMAQSDPQRTAGHLSGILAQVGTLEELLAGYGDFSRRSAGTDEVFDVRAPIRSARVILEHRAASAGVSLLMDDGVGAAVRGSLLAVQQAVVNLGQNAIDAVRGRDGGRVYVVGEGGGVVRVEDNGPGLPAIIREHLYEPFHTTKANGTGLGLALTRDLVVGSGGTLDWQDVSGGGTRWTITLPPA